MRSPNNGQSLLEILIAIGLFAALVSGFTRILQVLFKQQVQTNSSASVETVRRNIINTLQDATAWQNTIVGPLNSAHSATTGFSCLQTKTTCAVPAAPGYPFALYDRQGNLVYDGTVASNGLTVGGQVCSSFDPTNGNRHCPYHLDLYWHPLCTAPCLSPQVQVDGHFSLAAPSSMISPVFNSQRYDFSVILPTNPGPLVLANQIIAATDTTASAPGTWTSLANPESVSFSPTNVPLNIIIQYSATSSRTGPGNGLFPPCPGPKSQRANFAECFNAIYVDGVQVNSGSNRAMFAAPNEEIQLNTVATVSSAAVHTILVRHSADGTNTCSWTNRTLTVLRAN